jgi:hypothetical protein
MRSKQAVRISIIALALSIGAFVISGQLHPAPFAVNAGTEAQTTLARSAPVLLCDNCYWGVLGRNPDWGRPVDQQGILAATGLPPQDESPSSEQSSFFQSVLRYLLSGGGG